MMGRREQVKKALRHLEREPMPLRDPADEAARRHRIAGAVNARVRELAKEKRGETFRRQAALLACAAVVTVLCGVLWFEGAKPSPGEAASPVAALEVAGAVSVVRGGQSRELDQHQPPHLSPADVLRTATGASAHAVLASGAVVDVRASTAVRFESNRAGAEGSEDLALEKGEIALKVPKLGHRRLSVHTPDAVVTVRGTEFTVGVREDSGRTITGVKVVEGSVWVTRGGREITLEKGSEWSSNAAVVAAPVPEPSSQAPAPAAETPSSASPPAAPRASSGHDDPKSTLGAENDQYQQAVTAARAGDDRKALAGFETFLRRYPTSPLAQSAEVERFRALNRLGRTRDAARRAQQYLAAYPSGFARAEARALAEPGAHDTGDQ